jgi:transposase InsO family protein
MYKAQQEDDSCQTLMKDTLNDHSKFYIEQADGKPLLYRQAIDPEHKRVYVPDSIRQRIMHLAHYPKISGHPGAKKMFNTLGQDFYWPTMVADVYEYVKLCHECTKENSTLRKRTKEITLFPSEQPLDFIAIDILGPLTKTSKGYQYLLVIADRFSKLTRTIPLKTITTFEVASAFCHHWVFVYGAPRLLLSDNGTQFNSKFFQACCQILGIHQKFTTAYHPQCNGQVERFNRTILSQIRKYIGEHQNDWDLFNGALTYAYNTQKHTSTGCTPFELILSRPPPTLILQSEPTLIQISAPSQVDTVKTGFLRRLRTLIPQAQTAIARSGQRNQAHAAKSTRKVDTECLTDKEVWVRCERTISKLQPKVQGPYLVTRDLQDYVTINVPGEGPRNVSKERVVQVPAGNNISDTQDGKADGNVEYVIENLVGEHRNDKGHPMYRVRWEGYSQDEDTWELESSLPPSMVLQYLRNKVMSRSKKKAQS